MSSNRINSVFFLMLIMTSPCSFSEYSTKALDELGESIGGYISATNALEKIQDGECSYLFKKRYSTQKTIKEVMEFIPDNEKSDTLETINKILYGKTPTIIDIEISRFMENGKKNGLDTRTLCGMISVGYMTLYSQAKDRWDQTKKNHIK